MFRKLRNRFLLLNLAIISIMMLMAFSSIYLITWNNIQSSINIELNKISGDRQFDDGMDRLDKFGRDLNTSGDRNSQSLPDGGIKPADSGVELPDRSVSFFITTDSQWNIRSNSSVFDMEDSFYESAKKIVESGSHDTGTFKLDDTYWAYKVNSTPDGYKLSFLDITQRQGILTNLVYTFLIVALVMVLFIYLISRYFANRAIKPVQEAFEKQNQFLADASHELKTPLTVITTNVDVLLANGDETVNSQSRWLQYIKSESERMAKLTNNLLYLAQMGFHGKAPEHSVFNLSEAAENTILTMEAIYFEQGLKLDYEIESSLSVNGSSEKLHEVLMILLDNALKYTNPGGSVQVSLKKHHNDAALSVSNTGEGIPKEHLEKIFDRFYRTDKSRARKLGGHGLGLAIARAIMEEHHGRIYAESIQNVSTTFHAELPLAQVQ